MKAFAAVVLSALIGAASCLELIFNPDLYSVVEGGVYEVCVEIISGTAEGDQNYVIKGTYEVGSATVNQELMIPDGSGVGARFYAQFTSVDNEALDMGNTIFLELCPELEGSGDNGDATAEVLVADNDIVQIEFELDQVMVQEDDPSAEICVLLSSAAEAIRRPINMRIRCASTNFIFQLPIGTAPGESVCFFKPINVNLVGDESQTLPVTLNVASDLNVITPDDTDTDQTDVIVSPDDCVLQFTEDTPLAFGNRVRSRILETCLPGTTCLLNDVEFSCTQGSIFVPNTGNSRSFITISRSDGTSIRRGFRRDSLTTCASHFINEGTVVNTDSIVTFEWQGTGTGPVEDNFLCSLDGSAASPCDTPFTTAQLAPGSHEFIVTIDQSTNGCNLFRRLRTVFTIAP